MVDYTPTDGGQKVTNHKWVTEDELVAANKRPQKPKEFLWLFAVLHLCGFSFKAGLVKENTANATAIMTIKPPHQAVAVTEPVCPITPPPMADLSAMPICKADVLKLC